MSKLKPKAPVYKGPPFKDNRCPFCAAGHVPNRELTTRPPSFQYDNHVGLYYRQKLDNLADFCADIEEMSVEEMDQELREEGIDPEKAVSYVLEGVKRRLARC